MADGDINPDEGDPEALLDILAQQFHQKKFSRNELSLGREVLSDQELEDYVDAFLIDDAISGCFIDQSPETPKFTSAAEIEKTILEVENRSFRAMACLSSAFGHLAFFTSSNKCDSEFLGILKYHLHMAMLEIKGQGQWLHHLRDLNYMPQVHEKGIISRNVCMCQKTAEQDDISVSSNTASLKYCGTQSTDSTYPFNTASTSNSDLAQNVFVNNTICTSLNTTMTTKTCTSLNAASTDTTATLSSVAYSTLKPVHSEIRTCDTGLMKDGSLSHSSNEEISHSQSAVLSNNIKTLLPFEMHEDMKNDTCQGHHECQTQNMALNGSTYFENSKLMAEDIDVSTGVCNIDRMIYPKFNIPNSPQIKEVAQAVTLSEHSVHSTNYRKIPTPEESAATVEPQQSQSELHVISAEELFASCNVSNSNCTSERTKATTIAMTQSEMSKAVPMPRIQTEILFGKNTLSQADDSSTVSPASTEANNCSLTKTEANNSSLISLTRTEAINCYVVSPTGLSTNTLQALVTASDNHLLSQYKEEDIFTDVTSESKFNDVTSESKFTDVSSESKFTDVSSESKFTDVSSESKFTNVSSESKLTYCRSATTSTPSSCLNHESVAVTSEGTTDWVSEVTSEWQSTMTVSDSNRDYSDTSAALTSEGTDWVSEVTSEWQSTMTVSDSNRDYSDTSADESSYYSEEDCFLIEDDDENNVYNYVRLNLENEDCDDDCLRHQRLKQHLAAVLRLATHPTLSVESVITATGERLTGVCYRNNFDCSQKVDGSQNIEAMNFYKFQPDYNVVFGCPYTVSAASSDCDVPHSDQTTFPARTIANVSSHCQLSTPVHEDKVHFNEQTSSEVSVHSIPGQHLHQKFGWTTLTLFRPDVNVPLVPARQITSREFRESYDRSQDVAKMKRSELDSDIPWDLVYSNDTDDSDGDDDEGYELMNRVCSCNSA